MSTPEQMGISSGLSEAQFRASQEPITALLFICNNSPPDLQTTSSFGGGKQHCGYVTSQANIRLAALLHQMLLWSVLFVAAS